MMPNHHITKPVLIGEIQGDGQFNVVWQTPGPDRGAGMVAVSGGLASDLIADWRNADVVRQLQRQDRQVRRAGA